MSMAAETAAYTARDYKSQAKPVWCPGCGDYSVLSSITKALAELALPPEEVASWVDGSAFPVISEGGGGGSNTEVGEGLNPPDLEEEQTAQDRFGSRYG